MGVKIGDYIHLHYEHYEKYGLNTRASGIKETPNPIEIFASHHQNMINEFRKYKNNNEKVKIGLEKQLNYYFDLRKSGTKINNEMSNKQLAEIESAISQFLGDKIKNVDIDMNKLNSAFNAGNVNLSKFETEFLNKLKNANKIGRKNTSYVEKKTIENRIELLHGLRDQIGTAANSSEQNILDKIKKLDDEWKNLKNQTSLSVKGNTDTVKRNINFIDDLNSIIPGLIGGPSTVHGEYAEAMVVIMNYLATKGAIASSNELLKALETGVRGQDRSAKALDLSLFDESFVDVKMFNNSQMKTQDGVTFRTTETQDKVDVILEFDNLDIPASVKNYNMANVNTDVHLLSGRSVLMLVQQYPLFLNHYLNVVAEHEDKEANGSLLKNAHETMKLTILLKALAGGVFARDGKTKEFGNTKQAQFFIVNDNSGASNDGYGLFSVYFISDILDEVAKDLSMLKTGDYDNMEQLKNKMYFGDIEHDISYADAYIRISNLLMQLHKMKLDVSVNKKVFSNLK